MSLATPAQGSMPSEADSGQFATPHPTASLILSHRPPTGKVALILGTGKLAASRCFACLEAGIRPIIVSLRDPAAAGNDPLASEKVCEEIRYRLRRNMVSWKDISYSTADRSTSTTTTATNQQAAAIETTWTKLLDDLDEGEANSIFIVCITDTLHSGDTSTLPASSAPATLSKNAQGSTATLTAYDRAAIITRLCRKRRIPINVADKPDLCDFSFPAAHRFPCFDSASSPSSPLQIAVTTNGRGCRLAGRIRREIVSALPRNVGDAVEKVGRMRDMAKLEDQEHTSHAGASSSSALNSTSASTATNGKRRRPRERTVSGAFRDVEEDDLSFDTTPLNSPVPQLTPKNPLERAGSRLKAAMAESKAEQQTEKEREEMAERTKRRMRWVAQISEYWPIEYLGGLKQEQMNGVLSTYSDERPAEVQGTHGATAGAGAATDVAETDAAAEERRGRAATATPSTEGQVRSRSQHSLILRPPAAVRRKKGHIYLLGSGTGHPGLLTVLAHRLLSSPETHLILSDKLVPASILRLIPSSTPLEIAKKFPGNAEGAQSELIAMALRAAIEEGKTVVRLKQGDPFVYGRGGEEVLAFRRAGIECTVVPGISSALAAPLMLGIPVTQRGAADSLVLCTGVGRGGKKVRLPGYQRGRTLVVLMGVARLKAVVQTLTGNTRLGHGPTAHASSSEPDDASSVGDREGARFPPYTPIAIIERASSSDQRMVASTLEGIVDALERSGEQRPPGMMVIGWAVLSLEGEGDVTVSDDAAECTFSPTCGNAGEDEGPAGPTWKTEQEADAELERRDRARIAKWLGGRSCIVREGLDAAYRDALDTLLSASSAADPASTPSSATQSDSTGAEQIGWTTRTASGWAGPRYADGRLEGGWSQNEAPNRPARDQLAYVQDREYAEIRARIAGMDA